MLVSLSVSEGVKRLCPSSGVFGVENDPSEGSSIASVASSRYLSCREINHAPRPGGGAKVSSLLPVWEALHATALRLR